jgi:hypothetical protein
MAHGWETDRVRPGSNSYWNRRTNNAWLGWVGRAKLLQEAIKQERIYEQFRG